MQNIKARLIIVSIFFLVSIFLIKAEEHLDITDINVRLERLVCACGEYCEVKMCKVKFLSRHVATGNAVLFLKKKTTILMYSIKTYYKFSNNEYRPMGIITQYDFCAAQAAPYHSPLHTVIMNIISNYTNINRKCPLLPGEYYVKDLNLESRHLPSIIPAGRWLVNMTAYIQDNIWLGNVSIYVSLTNTGAKDFSLAGLG